MDEKIQVKIEEFDSSTQELLTNKFKGRTFARFGDIGCVMPKAYKIEADNIKNMAVRPEDLWLVTFPRSGTTWTQELVWMLKNDLDYETALKVPLSVRYAFIDMYTSALEMRKSRDQATLQNMPSFPNSEAIANAPSPRYLKTHLPFSLLPSNLLDVAKVVYVARDPRDVAVSFYHHNRLLWNYSEDFKTYWNLFINDLVGYTPFFPHLKEAWALRHHPNMLFLFYEDMITDLPSCIKRTANFLGKEIRNEQIVTLCEHLHIDNFRKNKSVIPAWVAKVGNPTAEGLIRKGKSGGWREVFNEEMEAQAQKWIRENLAGCDLRFPSASS